MGAVGTLSGKNSMLTCLGIESTAHTFGVGIFDGKANKANERAMYRGEGIHPMKASQFLSGHAHEVLQSAVDKARISLSDIDLFAFSRGPGLGPCLRVGSVIARSLARHYDKPLIGVNHCIAHIEVGKWNKKMKNPLVVYVSGANTQILGLDGGKYRIYGETLDVGMGNAIDMLARNNGMEFPGGPKVEKLAAKGGSYIELPYTVKGMDLAFSGLVTAASKKELTPDLAYSFQETLFAMLVEVSERALAHTQKKEVLLVGGVALNKRLIHMFEGMCKEHKARFGVPAPEYNGDNGFMIALAGEEMHKAGVRDELPVDQKWRTDDVDVVW